MIVCTAGDTTVSPANSNPISWQLWLTDRNRSGCWIINTEQTFHFDNRGMASRFVWPLTGGINQGQEQWTQLLRALSFLWRGRQFYARSVCREEKNHPSWSKMHQPSVDAHQEAVKHPHTLHGVGTSLCKKLYWCYSCVVWQQQWTDKLIFCR